ncbi:response regulator transcription factor [Bifidobacterium sp. ESL0764]|uniref:response regulator transcription factor n=1 Tax=Bifidobacterium sp. ESL0764 TaxID=2983228 RepID=UPI0023F89472|nr:response regulator transcription factor [Bifidobacterium sp. ESL0764]WEV65444.1 response regulator transcription factor [Bifidobacterium sp. ESL0764]
MRQALKTGILDNDRLSLDRITSVLPKLLPGLVVAWSTTSADEAVRRCLDEQWRPDLFITDVELDGTTGMEVCRRIRRGRCAVPILAMSSFSPRKYARQLSQAGAQGFMVKGNMQQMVAALNNVAAGDTFSPETDISFPSPEDACQAAEATPEQNDIFDSLSDLEQQILQQTSEGFTNEEIAESLNTAPATIRSHTRTIRKKLGAKTLSHAVALWLTHNITG